MIAEFKVANNSVLAERIGIELTEYYGCRIKISEWMKFCMYIKAEGKFENVMDTMLEASVVSESEENNIRTVIEYGLGKLKKGSK